MNIYDSIKSPFEDDENLKRIIEIYSSIKGPLVEGATLYKPLLLDYSNDIDKNIYMENFDEYIFWPITEDLFEKQKSTDVKNKDIFLKHKSYRDLYEYVGQMEGQLTEEQKGYLSQYDYASLANQTDIKDKYRKLICEKIKNGKEFLKERTLKKQIEGVHTFQNEGKMGFHFNSYKNDGTEKAESSEIKFYINAGEDTYKVAKLFLDKCRNAKMDSYYFKVVDPMSRVENEIGRTDRLCIYSTIEHAKKFIEFINEIKEQNPDINFMSPPMNTGTINGIIGVGQDQGKNSYNERMGDIISKVLNDICKEHNIKHQDLIKAINQNSNRLNAIRKRLYNEAKNNNMSPKVCINNELAEKLKTMELDSGKEPKSKKNQFIDRFIQAYDETETKYLYELRAKDEDFNIKRVQDIIGTNGFNRMLLFDLEGRFTSAENGEESKIQYSQKEVSAMARLLKASQLLTQNQNLNPEGLNYLEEFVSIPSIKAILKQMNDDLKNTDSYMFELKETAKTNRANGTLPNFPKTPGELEASDSFSTRSTSGQGLKQEMGISAEQAKKIEQAEKDARRQEDEAKRKADEEEISKSNEESAKQQKKLTAETVKRDIFNSKVTSKEAVQSQEEIAERKLRSSLSFRATIGTLSQEEQQRLAMLNAKYGELEKRKTQSTHQRKGNGMGR